MADPSCGIPYPDAYSCGYSHGGKSHETRTVWRSPHASVMGDDSANSGTPYMWHEALPMV